MDLKQLLFLKAAGGGGAKEEYPIYFSASSLFIGGTPSTSNSYGTTINTTSAEDNEVVVTQVYDSNYQPSSYRNGYVCVGFEKIPEWAEAGNTIIFDADIDVTENPASVSGLAIYIRNASINSSFENGKLHAELSNVGDANKNYVEVRCGGCSFTLSNCMITRVAR